MGLCVWFSYYCIGPESKVWAVFTLQSGRDWESILILNITPLKAKRKLELLFNFIVTFLINFMCCYR